VDKATINPMDFGVLSCTFPQECDRRAWMEEFEAFAEFTIAIGAV
jgi:hypothetical protein